MKKKIFAKLRPLPREEKYYGTMVRLATEEGEWQEINVWIGEGGPSRRELANLEEGEKFEYWDCHYESAVSLAVAELIAAALDGAEIEVGDE
jgi:hypothetical protein